jgi:hypothetical protein
MSKTALALAAYQALARSAHSAYRETKHVTGTVFRRGWRPLIPWVAVWIFAGLGWRLVNGLPIPGVIELLGVLGPITLPTMLAQWTRSIETRANVANAPGAFNSPGAQAGFA